MKNDAVKYTPEYKAIQEHYGDTITKRSGVKLIQHIDEGLAILELIGGSKDAMRAYCLHPLFQEDRALVDISKDDLIFSFSPRCVILAMEYRARANDWLSDKVYTQTWSDNAGRVFSEEVRQRATPDWGTLLEVKHMLIADKVQNYKDFLEFHYGTHERSEELNHYFLEWFKVLGIEEQEFAWMCKQLQKHE